MNSFPASSFKLLSGNGTINKHRITLSTCAKVVSDVQSFFSVLTQIAPVDASTLGWYILVKKCPLGGDAGKSAVNTSLT